MYEGSALTGIGHVSDWLASCSVCLCGFCHGIMEVWNPQGASTLQELNLKAPTCCSLGVTCNELLPLPTPTAALKSHSNAGTKAPEQGWVWEAVAPLRGSSDCLGRCSSEASLSKKKNAQCAKSWKPLTFTCNMSTLTKWERRSLCKLVRQLGVQSVNVSLRCSTGR